MPDATLSVPVTKADHVEGEDTAVITLVEYGDYQCPFCGQAYGLVKEIQRKMSYRLRFVFRNFSTDWALILLRRSLPRRPSRRSARRESSGRCTTSYTKTKTGSGYELLASAAATLSLLWTSRSFVYDIRGGRFRERIKRDFKGGVRSGVNQDAVFLYRRRSLRRILGIRRAR